MVDARRPPAAPATDLDTGSDAPEADVLEQLLPAADDEDDDELDSVPLDADPADALDQARVVASPDDDY